MKKISKNALQQIILINFVMALFWDIALLSNFTDKSNVILIIAVTLAINLGLIYEIYRIFYIEKKYTSLHISLMSFVRNKCGFFIISIIFIIISLTALNSWLNLDGFIYYKYLRDLKGWELGRFDKLILAGHNSQAYTILLLIGELLTPNNVMGVRIIHYFIALASIYSMYELVTEIVKESDEWERILYTSVFAFSPMFIGLISEVNTDFPLLCFFTCMVCCGIKKKYILQAAFGLMLCFSKETGVLLYGCYALGIILYRCIKERKSSIRTFFKNVFSLDIWLYASGGILWLANYIISNSSGWLTNTKVTSDGQTVENAGYHINSFGFFPEYIIVKFRQLIFVNSYWILYFLILVMLSITLFYGKKFFEKNIRIQGEILPGIILSFAAFLSYNFFYITYTGYRYLLPFAFFVSFGAIISVADLFVKKTARKIVLTVLVLIALASDFYTPDPFSKYFFQCQGTGTGDIIIPETTNVDSNYNIQLNTKYSYGITTINTAGMYNLQYAYLGICFDKTLKDIDYDENTLIIIPQQYRDAYGTMASIFGISVAGIDELYWDTELNQTNINCGDLIEKMSDDKRYKLINLKALVNMSDLDDYDKYNRIYYIELPFMKDFDHNGFLGDHKITDSHKTQYLCWKWKVDKLK